MFPVLLGLIAAMVFGLLSHGVYGTGVILAQGWIDMVFWALIGAGALVSFANRRWDCLPCRISRVLRAVRLQHHLCRDTACA